MIYLDNAATTRPFEEVTHVIKEAMLKNFANASSLHSEGIKSEKVTEEARNTIAKKAGIKNSEIIFTPGGTTANNLAISGYLRTKRGGKIITTAYEHPSVAECIKQYEKSFEVVYLKPENGLITLKSFEKELTSDTVFISIIHINNETGSISPIKELAALTHKKAPSAVFHTDAVQAFTKIPFDYSCVDMASFAAHKTHAAKGIGALYIRKGIRIIPIVYGGGQEKGVFSGTINTPLCVGWAKALEMINISESLEKVCKLNELTKKIIIGFDGVVVSPEKSSPYILSAYFDGYIAENILHYLSEQGIYISTGSACSAKHGSTVYKTLGLESKSKNALRISFSSQNTEKQIEIFGKVLKEALHNIIKK